MSAVSDDMTGILSPHAGVDSTGDPESQVRFRIDFITRQRWRGVDRAGWVCDTRTSVKTFSVPHATLTDGTDALTEASAGTDQAVRRAEIWNDHPEAPDRRTRRPSSPERATVSPEREIGPRGMPDTITKKALVDRIAEETDQKRVVVKKTIQTFLDLIIDELAEGNRLEFRDFGVFEVTVRAPRMAQNPKTLERVPVPAKKTVKFKVGRKMREELEAMPVDHAEEPSGDAKKPAEAARDLHINETGPDQIRPRPRQTNPATASA